jgi:hypothetical protein
MSHAAIRTYAALSRATATFGDCCARPPPARVATVLTDLTAGSGWFNLAQGANGAVLAIAAAASTGISGFIFQEFGRTAGFLAIAALAAMAAAVAWAFLPETKPKRYAD